MVRFLPVGTGSPEDGGALSATEAEGRGPPGGAGQDSSAGRWPTEADSILCELTWDATWRFPEIIEQDFVGGWGPALAGRDRSQQVTGDYCK